MLIYICDDEQAELEAVKDCLTKAAAELSASVKVADFLSGEALVSAVKNSVWPSLAVLDVYMEGMSGIETGRRLRAFLPGLPLAFLTASREFAVDAFDLDALHYIVKPVTVGAARTLLERLAARPKRLARMLELPGRQGAAARFPLAEINRILSKNRGIEVHVQGRSAAWLPCPFREAEARLSGDPDFLLLGRGCLVNLNSVQSIRFDICRLKTGEQLPISRRERLNVQGRYNDFLFRQLERSKGAAHD